MEHKTVEFPAGTPLRCDECSRAAPSPGVFKAARVSPASWRGVELTEHPRCGHRGLHWVYRDAWAAFWQDNDEWYWTDQAALWEARYDEDGAHWGHD